MTHYEELALSLRRTWLTAMGLSAEEVEAACDPRRFPVNLAEEQANVRALRRIQQLEREWKA